MMCTKCYDTGVRRHPICADGKACDCGWQPGGALRAAAEREAIAEAEALRAETGAKWPNDPNIT